MSTDDPSDPASSEHLVEVVVDLGAFLPETTAIGPGEPADDAALEPDPAPSDPDIAGDHAGDETEGTGGGGGTEPARTPAVDLAVLAGIEADLAAVDQAIEAIDSGDLARSPLLAELLGPPSA
ncbi:MAG: hypothetical protein JWM47_2365 [Acidimicrobiales bacterium]|nr:hypothetical protein [Acidimicrobiales bacterium]